MLTLGDKAPALSLPNQDNVEISLRDLEGKWIVLYFYPKDSTPGCTTEACDFTAALPAFEDLGAVVLGVSLIVRHLIRSLLPNKIWRLRFFQM